MGTSKSSIIDYKIKEELMIITSGSSKGTQVKYYADGYWYKKNRWGYEGLSETLVTEVLRCSNQNYYAEYEQCKINGIAGCRSKNFLKENESIITFQRLYEMYQGGNLEDAIRRYNSTKDRVDYILDFIYGKIRLDVKAYLSAILTLDMLTLNDDRHLNNLAIIMDAEQEIYKCAPIYDNGGALLSNFSEYHPDDEIEANIDKVIARPFSGSFEVQAEAVGFGLKLDYEKVEECIKKYPKSRAKEVLWLQLKRYQGILGESKKR